MDRDVSVRCSCQQCSHADVMTEKRASLHVTKCASLSHNLANLSIILTTPFEESSKSVLQVNQLCTVCPH